MNTRKTLKMEISNDQANKIYSSLINLTGNEFAGQWFQGSLMDEFAIGVGSSDWKFKSVKGRPILGRKYVYAREEYVNCWASRLVLTLTDNKEEFLNFVKSRFDNEENYDEIDFNDFCYNCGLND